MTAEILGENSRQGTYGGLLKKAEGEVAIPSPRRRMMSKSRGPSFCHAPSRDGDWKKGNQNKYDSL